MSTTIPNSKMKRHLLFSLLFGLSACLAANANVMEGLFGKKKTKTEDASAEVQAQLPEYKGVRHAIGVTHFDNEAGWRSQWELGENLALMLESALFDTNRFVIVERQDLGDALAEQDLQASGRAAEATQTAQTGLVRSAKYIATGAVTRVDANTAGDNSGFAIRGLRIGGGSNKAEIEVVVKLVDTTSSQVVASKRITGTAGGSKLRIGVHHRGVAANLGSFAKTPIGEAAQDCITQASLFIAQEMEDYEVTANVVMARSEDVIVINRGGDYGLAPGHRFAVREEGEVLTDPATGEILDVFEGKVTGEIEVTRVSDKVAYCKLVDGALPARGDGVILNQ